MRKAAALFLLLLSGCGSIIRKDFTETGRDFDFREPQCKQESADGDFSVRYLGSGGVYIEWQGDGLLIGPYFSHSGGFVQAEFAHTHFDRTRIAAGMQGIDDVRAIL